MGESRDTHSDQRCDICGATGYEELVNTCSRCTIRRHFYCMRVLVRNKLEDWICELCLLKNDIDYLNSGQTKNILDSSRNVSFDLGRHVTCKRKRAVETGKVKFLPTEEAMKLSSGLPKTAFPSNSNSGSKPVPANFTPSPSKRLFMGSKNVGPCFNPIKVRKNPTFLQLGSVGVPRCRGMQISSSSRQYVQIPNKSKEAEEKAPQTLAKKYGSNEKPVSSVMAAKEVKSNVDAKAMNEMKETSSVPATSTLCSPIINTESVHVVPNKENVHKGKISDTVLPDKEFTNLHSNTEDAMRATRSSPSRHHTTIISSGQSFPNVAEPENRNVPKIETGNRLKVSLYRPHAPSLYATWKGGFKFHDTATLGEYFGGFLARPPCRVHRKAYKFSMKMPPVLQVNLLQQCHLQADILQNGCLDLFDIALYFFPAEYTERSQKNYNQLFELMEMKNSVMISYIDDTELLIFTSKQLHADSQDMFTKSNMDFFVGIFCHAKENRMKLRQEVPSLVSSTHDDGNVNMDSSEAVDMDIDMINGKVVGIPDVVLSKASTPEFNKQARKETPVSIRDGKFSTFSGDLNSAVQLTSPESKQEGCIESDLPSKSIEKINSKFPVEPPSESSLGRLPGSIEANMFPGFGMSKFDSSDEASKGKNVLNERGIMSQVKEETVCPGKMQVAVQVFRPQPHGYGEALGVCRPQLHGSTKDDSLQQSQNQNQVSACHQINDPSAACLPPCILGEGREIRSGVKTEVHEDEKPFKRRELCKDESQIAGSCAVKVKAEVQEVVNDCTAVCPSRLLNTGPKLAIQIKAEEHEGEKSDEMREKGLRGSSRLSEDKSKTIAGSSNDICTVKDKTERHVILPGITETSLCSAPFASPMVKLSVAGRSASAGGLIRDESGRWIVGYNLNLGICNCLAADLWALYQGMKLTRDRGYKKVQVESDSAAAVVSLKKAPSLVYTNRALIESCRSLIKGEWDCKVYIIRREENQCAEWLATHVGGCQLGLSMLNLPPLELIPLLEDDYKRFGENTQLKC
ncbi:hypothetical protein V6N11_011310 [Hibiscus sabdariffa]|uniref:Zinc finger PHD-type domain-containing protein n=1 Tax=Hibiscus sabdariffa TaxID=183260 RepID=A0ABR2S7W9_9ROSI